MTSLSTLQGSNAGPYRQVARAVVRGVTLILGYLAQAYRARRDSEHIMGFSDHLLKDIGVARCEIEAAVRWGPERQ